LLFTRHQTCYSHGTRLAIHTTSDLLRLMMLQGMLAQQPKLQPNHDCYCLIMTATA
jgi:hypothetical protein